MTTTLTDAKAIVYDRHEREFAAYFDGELIGFFPSYLAAETALNDHVLRLCEQGLVDRPLALLSEPPLLSPPTDPRPFPAATLQGGHKTAADDHCDERPAEIGVIAALRALIAADNCNYARDTMRYEGLFEAGRAALEAATGEYLGPHPDDSPIWTPAESAPALRDMLSLMLRTVNDTLRHGLTQGQRESLDDLSRRAALLLRETPSNE